MSDVICTNCHGESTTGCWLCRPSMNPAPIKISVPPPIPLPEFDVWEQLGKARDRIRELEAALKLHRINPRFWNELEAALEEPEQ